MASETFRVRDKRNGNIRTVTRTAYMAMGPKVYEKIAEVDASVPATSSPVHRSVSAPVIRPQIKVEQEQVAEPEQVETQAEPEVTQTINEIPAAQPKRRGRPKTQISSDSTETEK